MYRNTRRATFALLLATAAFAPPAFAQDEPPAVDDGSVIVVTAQKREENLQDVPISIQALGTQKLDDLNITNFEEYSQLLPSLSFQTLQPGVTTVYMRGVASGGDGNHSGSLPSVGTYLDEQPVTTIGGTLDVHIYDIARIESLAGPQGTLYGASSQAGTIRIITNKPDTSGFYGRVDGEVNSVEHGGIGGRLEGFVNAPINQNIALRVVGFYQKDAGYIDNIPGSRPFIGLPTVTNTALVEDDFNDAEIYGGRAALKIDLDDNWTVTPTVLYQKARYNGVFGQDTSLDDLQVQRFFEDYREDEFIQGAMTIEGRIGNWDVTYAGAYLDRQTASSSDYTDYAEAYDQLYASVGGVAGYLYFWDNAGNVIDTRQKVIGSDHFKKMSHELRLSSPAEERLRVVAGLFYQRQSNLIHQDYQVANLAANLSVNGFPGTLWLTQQERVDKDYAGFGEASFDIADNLTVTAGGRVYKYDNSLIGFFGFGRNPTNNFEGSPPNAIGSNRSGVAQCFTASGQRLYDRDSDTYATNRTLLPPVVDGSPCTNLGDIVNGEVVPRRTKDTGFIHRLNLTWKPTEDVMFYGTWSKGFRPGGINRRGTLPPYDADFLTNYEFGWKTTLADGHVRFNGAIYWQEWKNFQFSFLGENSFTEIHNGPDARIRGLETDLYINTGAGFTFNASASFTDAVTTQDLCTFDDPTDTCTLPGPGGAPNSVTTPSGTRLPITPEFKASLTSRYDFDIGSSGRGHAQLVLAHQSPASSDIRAPAALSIGTLPEFSTGNAAVGAELGDISIEAFIQNIWDERAQLTRYQACGNCGQRTYALVTQPRTYGIRAGFKF